MNHRYPTYQEWLKEAKSDFEISQTTYNALLRLASILDKGLTEKI